MATYLDNVNDILPQSPVFQPDFNYYTTMLQRKASMYQQGLSKTKSAFNDAFNSDMVRDSSIAKRDEYLKNASDQLKKMASWDFSLPQNVEEANKIFQPIYEDPEILADILFVKGYQAESQKKESYRSSADSETRKLYWQTGDKALQYQLEEFKKADKDSAVKMKAPRYINNVDLLSMAEKKFKDSGIEVKKSMNDGKFIWEVKNGNQILPLTQTMVMNLFSEDPAVAEALRTQAYVDRKDYAKSNAAQYGSEENAEIQYINNVISTQLTEEQNRLTSIKTKISDLNSKRKDYEELVIKKRGVIPGSREHQEYQQILKELELTENSFKKQEDLVNMYNSDDTDLNTLRNRADSLMAQKAFSNSVMSISNYLANKNSEATVKMADPYVFEQWQTNLEYKKQAALENLRFSHDKELAVLNSSLKKSELEFEKGLKKQDDGFTNSFLATLGFDANGSGNTINLNTPAGGTTDESNKTLYDRNVLTKRNEIVANVNKSEYDFIASAFSHANKPLSYQLNGKTVMLTPDQLKNSMNNPAVVRALTKEANKIYQTLDKTREVPIALLDAKKKMDDYKAVWIQADKLMNSDLNRAVNNLVTKTKNNSYKSVVKNGRLLSEEEYIREQQSLNPNSKYNLNIKNSSPFPAGSLMDQEWQKNNIINKNKQKSLTDNYHRANYKKLVDAVKNEYNNSKDFAPVEIASVLTQGRDFYGRNKGGASYANVQQLGFSTEVKGDNLMNVAQVLRMAQDPSKIAVVAGENYNSKAEIGSVDEDAQKVLNVLLTEMARGAYDKNYKVDGTLKFSAITSGNTKQNAYVIKLDPTTKARLIGTKTAPGPLFDFENFLSKKKILEEGFTIVVNDQDDISTIGRTASKPLSSIESIMNMSDDGTYRYRINGAGEIIAQKTPDNGFIISGVAERYNPKTHDYERVEINPQRVSISLAGLELDRAVDLKINDLKSLYQFNNELKNAAKQSEKVIKDPKALQN